MSQVLEDQYDAQILISLVFITIIPVVSVSFFL